MYAISPSHQGNGFATELVQHSLQYGLKANCTGEVSAFAKPMNVASIRVLEKSGFKLAGYEPELRRNRYAISKEPASFCPSLPFVTISLESPDQAEIRHLIEELDAYQKPLYPAASHHGLDVHALSHSHALFAVARSEQGDALACGAMVLAAAYGEVKRMYTREEQRGRGLARGILSFLEAEAAGRGCSLFVLETGSLQPEAISLYGKCGYERCRPFGDYVDDPHSVFMSKSV
jgi:putative acetyltransferase